MKPAASFLPFRIFLAVFVLLSFLSRAQSPVASFTMSVNQACAPASIQFTNTSVNAITYSWNFGNGNSSSLANPGNVYSVAGTFTITLTVTSASGTTSSTSKQITIHAAPHAAFTAVNTTVCEDYQPVTFQNSSTGYDSCLWDFGDGNTSVITNPVHYYSNSGTYNVKLIVFNKVLGCSDFIVKNSLVTILARPEGTITADTNKTCDQNHLFSFSASVTGSPVSWLWNFGDGTTSTTQGNVTKMYSSSGNYLVSLILQNANGCIDTLQLTDTIKVLPNPVPVLTRSDSTGCEPLVVYFGCNPIAGATYSWNLGNGNSSSLRNPGITYQNAGTFTPVFTINYSGGCSRTITMSPVVVKASPQTGYTMVNGSGCAPLTVTFTNTTPGINTYMWHFDDGDSTAQTHPVHTYNTPGAYYPTLIASSPSGCTRSFRSGWNFINASGPLANFRPDITSGCSPLTVNFSNLTNGNNTYFWDFGDGTTSTQQHPAHTYTANGNYTVKLIATNSIGCVDTFIHPAQINVSNLSIQSATTAPITVCAPYTVYFSDNTAASAWLWDFDDGSTSTVANPMHTYTEPGVYHVDLTVWMQNGGCSYTLTNIQEIHVVKANPGFTWNVTSCPPYDVQFTDTTSNAVAWNWSFGDGTFSSQQHPVHTYFQPGTYNVSLTVTSSNGCSATYSSAGGVTFTGLGAKPYMTSTDTVAPYAVQFYSNSTNATSWLWNFGDGNTSTQSNPAHVYATNGPFTISLTVANDSCSYTYTNPPLTIGTGSGNGGSLGGGNPPPYVRNVRCAPYAVNFYNPVPGVDTLTWVFGDGTTSILPNPVHIYADTGIYIASLIYTMNGITDTLVYSDTFFVSKAPSDFDIVYQNTCNGVVVNVSVNGNGLTNTWEFGSGSTVTGISASHTYPNVSGNNIIRLNSSNSFGCKSTIAKSFSINLDNPLSAGKRRGCAGDSIVFSPGNLQFNQYEWDFGDNTFSTSANPIHVYADSGLYQVKLKATDINGCVTWFNMNYTVEIFDPVANFTILKPYGNCDWVFTRVFNASTGANSYLWNFGDGSYSTDFNMFHYYSQPGFHDITLTATNNVCSSTMILPHAVYVADLTPAFTYTTTGNCLPATLQFTDTSIDAKTWHWEFGDGDTSVVQHPLHVYTKPPAGPVILTVTDTNGCVRTVTDTVIFPTMANFNYIATGGCSPFTASFADTSFNGVSFKWDFADGTTDSVNRNPVHTYSADGFYPVTLNVTGPDGCVSQKTQLITVMTPVAAFNADSLDGCAPLMVNFVNESSGSTTYSWDFGDGDMSSLLHPQHIYSDPGVYDVTLIASNDFGCSDTLRFSKYIRTRGAVPDFTLTPLSGCAPLSVSFTDASVGAVSWHWYFGDGNTVTGQNVSHVYSDSGTFTPSLYTTDSTGCTSVFTYPQPVVVNSLPIPVATDNNFSGCSPVTVNYDASLSQADSLLWDMGDGTFFNSPVVNYSYSTPGNYQVQLIAFNADGCSDTLQFTPVNVYSKPVVTFNSPDTTGCFPFAVTFNNTSTGLSNATYQWNFGNGITDTSANPSVIYQSPGVYDVTLISTNAGGCSDSLSFAGYITVYDHEPPSPVNWKGVTVISNSEVQLDFNKSTEPDMDHYVVYRLNSSTQVFDSIAVINHHACGQNISWIDHQANPASAPCTYKVVAVDLCDFRLPTDSVSAQTTVHLRTTSGWMSSSLQWTKYRGKAPSTYGIYRSFNSSSYQRIATVPVNDTLYNDTTAYCPVLYNYRISADNLDNTAYNSVSNTAASLPSSNIADQEVEIIRTTVVDNAFTLTEWKEPLLYPWLVNRYQIFRSYDNVQFTLIADVPAMIHEYEDHVVNVQSHEFYYKVTAVSECGSSEYSGPGSSIWLQSRENNLHYFLKWTPYTEWDTGVDKYRVEKLNDQGMWDEMKTVNGTVTEVEEE